LGSVQIPAQNLLNVLYANITNYTKNSVRRNHKTFTRNFQAIFRPFSAQFSAEFARNLRKLRAILAQILRNFLQGLTFG